MTESTIPAQVVIAKCLLRAKMFASILGGHRRRLTLWRHERAAVHREDPQVGAEPESGGAVCGLRGRGVTWNALRGRSQDDRDRKKEIGKGLLVKMLADLGIDRDEFQETK